MSKLKTGPWTKAEEATVRRYAFKLTNKELATKLNRAYGGVVWKKQQLLKAEDCGPAFIATPITEPRVTTRTPSLWDRVKEFFS